MIYKHIEKKKATIHPIYHQIRESDFVFSVVVDGGILLKLLSSFSYLMLTLLH